MHFDYLVKHINIVFIDMERNYFVLLLFNALCVSKQNKYGITLYFKWHFDHVQCYVTI